MVETRDWDWVKLEYSLHDVAELLHQTKFKQMINENAFAFALRFNVRSQFKIELFVGDCKCLPMWIRLSFAFAIAVTHVNCES